MITVPEAAAILNRMVAEGVTEGFLAVLLDTGNVTTITGFELVDDWCLAKTDVEVTVG